MTENKSAPESRKPARVNSKLEKNLVAYLAAASAAGVGMLSASPTAEAKIVYTAANVTIPANGGVQFDLNNDGIPDFGFSAGSYFGSLRAPLGLYRRSLTVIPAKAANEVWGVQSQGFGCAAALLPGAKVGPGDAFQPDTLPMFDVAGDYTNQFYSACPWRDKKHGAFLGLKFVIDGQTHYGWAHVTGLTLNGYAYETVPNQPIQTGKTSGPSVETSSLTDLPSLPDSQPATLATLAQGSDGLSLWRKPEGESALLQS